MELGVYLHGSSPFTPKETIEEYIELARYYDQAGVHSLWFADHLIRTPDTNRSALFESWSLIAGLSQHTSSILFGTMVSPITFRLFGPFAKQLVTIDHLSKGRIIAGLGAGWSFKEYEMMGVPFPSTTDRLQALEEWVDALLQLFDGTQLTYKGQFVKLNKAYLNPTPINDSIPILIGGGGEKKTLKLVAKYAQYSNFGGDTNTLRHKLDVLQQHCTEVGRNFSDITPTTNRATIMGRTAEKVEDGIISYLDRFKQLGRQVPSRDTFTANRLVGTPEEVITQLNQLHDLSIGLTVMTVNDQQTIDLIPDLVGQYK